LLNSSPRRLPLHSDRLFVVKIYKHFKPLRNRGGFYNLRSENVSLSPHHHQEDHPLMSGFFVMTPESTKGKPLTLERFFSSSDIRNRIQDDCF
jgi:hypothetical protein